MNSKKQTICYIQAKLRVDVRNNLRKNFSETLLPIFHPNSHLTLAIIYSQFQPFLNLTITLNSHI